MIQVENLTKKFNGTPAVSDVSFSVEEGEVLGFLGPNGAGKTTTMRAITGFLPATSGRVTVGGFDVFASPIEARRRIGYLPEHPPLYPEMTVDGYLRFVARIKGVPSSDLRFELDRVMETARIDDMGGRIISRLSRGYRQRVGLAQALVGDPPVLILDEPTVGLDPKQIHEVRELIRSWKGRHTVVLSTHILPEVEQTCHRVAIIARGRIVAIGTPAHLVERLERSARIVMDVAAPAGEAAAALGGVPGVADVRVLDASDGRARLEVEAAGVGADVEPELARAIVERGWGLFGMQSSTMSLEDIFLELTTDEPPGGEAAS